VESFGLGQTLMDKVEIALRSRNAALRFLLEGVQDIDRFGAADGINSTPRVAAVVCDYFKHRPSAKAFQWLGRGIGFALLRRVESQADVAPDLAREPRASL
jgi:hypothetical protein